MWKYIVAIITFSALTNAWANTELTELETQWLTAGWPVLTYAKEMNLPLDIMVQPDASPGDAPLAMGFEGGRCKLVLSMRGNPAAESAWAKIAPAQRNVVIEAMTAHEIGHCWRYLQGAWHALPAGFVEVGEETGSNKAMVRQKQEMRETRREEGFADLVGLAWTLRRHPEQYAQVHAWFEQARHDQPVPGSYHDTRVWIQLAKDGTAFENKGNLFEQVQTLWRKGLVREN